jgi:hypothetical protein
MRRRIHACHMRRRKHRGKGWAKAENEVEGGAAKRSIQSKLSDKKKTLMFG